MEKGIGKFERSNEMPLSWELCRDNVMRNFESKVEGLDMKRVREFVQSSHLPLCDAVIFYEEDIEQLQQMFEGVYNVKSTFLGTKKMEGVYIPEIKLILYQRNREREKANGGIYSEGIIVHELFHGTNSYVEFVKNKAGTITPRVGFTLCHSKNFPWGWFLEEGFADMMRGAYCEQNISEEMNEKIKKSLRRNIAYRDQIWQKQVLAELILRCL